MYTVETLSAKAHVSTHYKRLAEKITQLQICGIFFLG